MLELINLKKKYGAVEVVKGISFTLRPGEIVGYLGPNGAGKTTTLNMLAGLLNQTDGQIRYNNVSIREEADKHRRRVGYLPERSDLFDFLSAYEFLDMLARLRGLPGKGIKNRIEGLLEQIGLGDSAHHPIADYSKGMRQKVLILSAMIHDPDILLLDEPMSGLDVFSIAVLRDLLKLQASRGRIVLYSTHQLDTVNELCHRVIVLHQGRIHLDIDTPRLQLALAGKGLDTLFQEEIYDQNSHNVAQNLLSGLEARP